MEDSPTQFYDPGIGPSSNILLGEDTLGTYPSWKEIQNLSEEADFSMLSAMCLAAEESMSNSKLMLPYSEMSPLATEDQDIKPNLMLPQSVALPSPTLALPSPAVAMPPPSVAPAPTPVELPSPTGLIVSHCNWRGDLGFRLSVQCDEAATRFMYSAVLGEVFVSMLTVMNAHVSLAKWLPQHTLRALPVYQSTQGRQLPVRRCPFHMYADHDSNTGFDRRYLEHVLRIDSQDARYMEDPESHRLSVVVPVEEPDAGVEFMIVPFKFACLTSCAPHRNPVFVVFTLEDESGKVVGRQHIKVRICSCPKRDLGNAESKHLKKPPPEQTKNAETGVEVKTEADHCEPPKKTVKLEPKGSDEEEEFTIRGVGLDNCRRLLTQEIHYLLGRAGREKRDLTAQESAAIQSYEKKLAEISAASTAS